MRVPTIAWAVFAVVSMVATSVAADARDEGQDRSSEPNLIAFVGRRLSVHEVEPKGAEIPFDSEYRVRAEVIQVVYGRYAGKEMEFSSYVHVGKPAFGNAEFGLVYVSTYRGRLVQQKYLFQPVHRTRGGRWASCGDPYAWLPGIHRHGVKAEAIAFEPPVTFDIRKGTREQGVPAFEAPFFRIQHDVATCLMGNYPPELFRVMAEGYLKARGLSVAQPERKQ